MKPLQLCTVFIIAIMTSCSTEPQPGDEPDNAMERIAENNANPYDAAGKLHAGLSEKFIDGSFDITTIEAAIAQVETLAGADSIFTGLKDGSYRTPKAQRIVYLTEDQPGRIPEIIDMSPLSWKAKISLMNYLSSLAWYQDQKKSPEEIIDFIMDYEVSVIEDADFTENDRRIVLTTSSISRYSYDMQRRKVKRRDRDWELSIGNFLTGTGSTTTAEAVTMSVVAGIMTNK